MTAQELKRRLEVARMCPDVAHLPTFGLALEPNDPKPQCRKCQGFKAPIIDGLHLDGFCEDGQTIESGEMR